MPGRTGGSVRLRSRILAGGISVVLLAVLFIVLVHHFFPIKDLTAIAECERTVRASETVRNTFGEIRSLEFSRFGSKTTRYPTLSEAKGIYRFEVKGSIANGAVRTRWTRHSSGVVTIEKMEIQP